MLPTLRTDVGVGAWTTLGTVGLLWMNSLVPAVMGKDTPYLNQGFFFDWTPQNQSPPIPTTAQCETIHIEYGRGNAVGPNPVAPYYLQIYTSTFIVPLVVPAGTSNADLNFDWPVPFIPGTQYQICMFDSNGVTGGCQAVYTVYPAPNTTLNNPPVCTNLTYPQQDQVLGVTALVDNGPLGQFAWIPQCTDISVKPNNGTPPFTMTVAPALHPPYNITSNSMDPINWTVSLSWGMPFFISLADSTGMTWAFGPLHSGEGTDTTCLAELNQIAASSKEVQPWVAAVSGAGGLIVGLVAGLLGAVWFTSRRKRNQMDQPYTDLPTPPADTSYHIEPFVMPSERELGFGPSHASSPSNTLFDSRHTRNTSAVTTGSADRPRSPTGSVMMSPISNIPPAHVPLIPPHRPLSSENRSQSQVFVVHHDGGRAPVTVYAADGTEIVELPPRYNESNSGTAGGSSSNEAASTAMRTGTVPPLQPDRRQPGAMPAKAQRRVVS
ncbi:uncharacterized protein PHACADRAFT_133507 [Phanerochaete carnosa HHB-10118-sp]|uniref:Uncharacterized protein n=1 Tax=Phanerochaete carnosa (strain HHB-10118-sp) TaxID=650164 RepID=K5W9Z1_PHACS|nr:uncharacterized protein PHACADRAFT_133507 [Phanerochaete carnosa HHB-10118-sp]EKM60758.1 hypothetical protein PHACADRAFT_133507 [Phanerochaete carnosa HHB-10118-sp]